MNVYLCTNPECDAETTVREWAATRIDPPDSTWGDGCSKCGAELRDEPEITEAELKAEAEIARAEAAMEREQMEMEEREVW